MRHEHTALTAGDQFFRALRSADERKAAGAREPCRLLALLLCPEPRVRQVPQDSFFNPDNAAKRNPLRVKRLRPQSLIRGIRIERDALIRHLLTDTRTAFGL